MKTKLVIASVVIVSALVFGATSFVETNVEYTDFKTAMSSHKKFQVKGEWLSDKESSFDVEKMQFIFYMKDEQGQEMKIVFGGAKPNNFELATSIVVKGRYDGVSFQASEILTKCPSKYEGDAESTKNSL